MTYPVRVQNMRKETEAELNCLRKNTLDKKKQTNEETKKRRSDINLPLIFLSIAYLPNTGTS